MRLITLSFLLAIFSIACNSGSSEDKKSEVQTDSSQSSASKDTSKKSIPSEVNKWVGNTDINIKYHAPGVRGRVIWGGLVPYDQVWVTGAHKATLLELGKAFRVGDKTIPAGKYALFTIPGKDAWTIIINKNWNQHLTDDYSETQDVARISVKPQSLDTSEERLRYEIDQKEERLADIIIRWEKVSVSFGIEVL